MKTTGKFENEEKRRLVEEWDRSGLSSEAFGRTRGIRADTLQAWGREVRGPLRRRSRTRLVPRRIEVVEVGPAGRETREVERRLEIVLTTGRRLVLFTDWTPKLIAEVAAQLEADR